MSNRNFISLGILLLTAFNLNAQQEPQLSQTGHLLNTMFPSFNGWHGGLQVSGLTRQQFTGFEGRPETFVVNTDGYISKAHTGIGIQILEDRLGQMTFQRIQVSVAPRIILKERIAILPSFGFVRNKFAIGCGWRFIDQFRITPHCQAYTSISNQINAGIGLIVHNWYAALNYRSEGSIQSPTPINNSGWTTTFKMAPIYSAITGTSFSKWNWQFQPSIQLNSSYLPLIRTRLNLNMEYKNFMLAASWGLQKVVELGAGYEFCDRYRISYATSIWTPRIRRGTNLSHELAIRILLFDRPEHRIISNVGIF